MSLPKQLVLQFVRTKFKLLSSISKRKAAEKAFKLFCTPQVRTIKALPFIFEKSEKIEFSFQGNIVRGYRWNHPSRKKALILHGFEQSFVRRPERATGDLGQRQVMGIICRRALELVGDLPGAPVQSVGPQ